MKNINLRIYKLLEAYPGVNFSLTTNTPSLTHEAVSFLAEHCFLKTDLDYFTFLTSFGGISYASKTIGFNLYGVDADVSLHIKEGEGDVINDDGFLCIGDFSDHSLKPDQYVTAGLFFNATKVSKGIFYNQFDQFDNSSGYLYLCKDFQELVSLIINRKLPGIFKPV